MAREARFLHADALIAAIHHASGLLPAPVERLTTHGSMIRVEGGGRRVVFRMDQSQTYDPETGTPTLGGTSGEALLVSGPDPIGLSRLLALFRAKGR
jgi:hypothetical protein